MNKEAALLNARYELKFNAKSSEHSTLRSWVLNHPLAFSPLYHPRLINNIYFDTTAYSHYIDNVLGVSDRNKIRIRWYGATLGEIKKPVLEIKRKKLILKLFWILMCQTALFSH